MADWFEPNVATDYITVLQVLKDRDVDAVSLSETPANPPLNYIRLNRISNIFQTWDGAGWVDIVIGVTGGGTGATEVGVGLGTMATQNNNAVNITGGTITGVSLSAASITGVIPLSAGGTGASLALGPIGHVLASDGNQVAFHSGVNIPQLNANSLITGNVPVARLNLLFNSGNTWTGGNTFNSSVLINYPTGFFNAHLDTIQFRANQYIDIGQTLTPDVYLRSSNNTYIGSGSTSHVQIQASTLVDIVGRTIFQGGDVNFLSHVGIDSGYLHISGAHGGIRNVGSDRVPVRQDIAQAQYLTVNHNTYLLVLSGGPVDISGISGENGSAPGDGKRMAICNAGASTNLLASAGSGNYYGFFNPSGAQYGLPAGATIELYFNPPYWFPMSR